MDEQPGGTERADDEMEVSDEEDAPRKKQKQDGNQEEHNSLKEENNILRCQMEAYKNEVGLSILTFWKIDLLEITLISKRMHAFIKQLNIIYLFYYLRYYIALWRTFKLHSLGNSHSFNKFLRNR